MDSKKLYKNFEKIGLFWLTEVEKYNEGPFKKKRKEDEWSIGQLYAHLTVGTFSFHLVKMNDCIEKRNGNVGGKKKFRAKWSFMNGKLSYKKKKKAAPKTIEQPENISEAKNNMIRLLKVMEEMAPKAIAADPTYKTEHPIYGWLNALEWYELIRLHLLHHVKQKKKIDKMFKA